MLKQEYRQVLELLYETVTGAREAFNRFTALLPMLSDPLLVSKISFYIHEMIEMPEDLSIEMGVKLRLHVERANQAREDLEEYLLLKIKEKPIHWQEAAAESGWGPLADLQKENEELRKMLHRSEDLRKKYTKGKQEMYAMGGEVAKAAFKCLPHVDCLFDKAPLTK